MKISEFQNILTKIKDIHGDIELSLWDTEYGVIDPLYLGIIEEDRIEWTTSSIAQYSIEEPYIKDHIVKSICINYFNDNLPVKKL